MSQMSTTENGLEGGNNDSGVGAGGGGAGGVHKSISSSLFSFRRVYSTETAAASIMGFKLIKDVIKDAQVA